MIQHTDRGLVSKDYTDYEKLIPILGRMDGKNLTHDNVSGWEPSKVRDWLFKYFGQDLRGTSGLMFDGLQDQNREELESGLITEKEFRTTFELILLLARSRGWNRMEIREARRRGCRIVVVGEGEELLIRTCPENYGIAHLQAGEWVVDLDAAIKIPPSEIHSVMRHVDAIGPDRVAEMLDRLWREKGPEARWFL